MSDPLVFMRKYTVRTHWGGFTIEAPCARDAFKKFQSKHGFIPNYVLPDVSLVVTVTGEVVDRELWVP